MKYQSIKKYVSSSSVYREEGKIKRDKMTVGFNTFEETSKSQKILDCIINRDVGLLTRQKRSFRY